MPQLDGALAGMLAVFAWFERDILRDRARAKKGEGVRTESAHRAG